MSCPNLDTLLAAENHEHLQKCESCRSLALLHSLERPAPDACAKVEGFLCLLDELRPDDAKLLHGHLAGCPACTVSYLTLVDDAHPSEIESPAWKGPAMEHVEQPHMIRTRTAVLAAFAFAGAALVLFALMRKDVEHAATTETTASEAGEARLGASRPAVVPPSPTSSTTPATTPSTTPSSTPSNTVAPPSKVEAPCDEVTCLVDPSKPCCSVPNPDADNEDRRTLATRDVDAFVEDETNSEEKIATLVEESRSAMKDKRYARGLARCEMALSISPENQEARLLCGIAACNLKSASKAEKHLARLKGDSKRAAVRQICLRQGVQFADESVEALVAAADTAVRDQEYAKGLTSCTQALDLEPSHQRARTICGIAACNLGRGAIAKRHIEAIEGKTRRVAIEQICLRLKVDL